MTKKLNLSGILDLYDGTIVSYAMGTSNNNPLVFETFDKAMEANPGAKPLFHSDRGFQYTSKVFKSKLDKAEATHSMSRVGRCIDNGPTEGFWGTLKAEMYYLNEFHSIEELKKAIEEYIDFYNNKRFQTSLKGLTPVEYRNQALAYNNI
ncbi:IS3 family transposase [Mycoplasmatota bacterium]|nr:IS3 family transposase [Mycoplasmatota bacterium]